MTREERLTSLRTKDLVKYAQKLGVKVSQTRGMLKEARAGVIKRIIAAEEGKLFTVEDLADLFMALSDDANVADIFDKVSQLSPEDQIRFLELTAGTSAEE